MSRDYNRIECTEQTGKFLSQIGVSLAVAERFDGILLVLGTKVIDYELLCPVSGIKGR